jgi:branched-chain amino acid transport system ATP-binding protein
MPISAPVFARVVGKYNVRDPILNAKNLSKSFGSIVIAKELSLTVKQGEAVGIIGPNGAGKSTILGLLAGDTKAESGTIELDGTDVTRHAANRRCNMGIGRTFQIPQPFGRMTVLENVRVAAAFGDRRSSSLPEEILKQTGLESVSQRLAGTLPLLSRKRLELARALATSPKILLLDEIAGGLTDVECEELVILILQIRDRGVAILWIEHVLRALTPVVSRILALNGGKWIAEDTPYEVLKNAEVRRIYMGSFE